jgi:UDPglucose--hexose-1-phosphate uridylyltransferase
MSLMKDRYEMTAEPQRDITPEQASKRLRVCDLELYRDRPIS